MTVNGITSIPVSLKRGLFQGDSLSPLLFCLCVAPVSHQLRKGQGYNSKHQSEPITHLMFVDDLKVYEETPERMTRTMRKVDEVSGAMGITMGLKKCAVAHARGGRMVRRGPLRLKPGTCVCEIGDGGCPNYVLKADLKGQSTRGGSRVGTERQTSENGPQLMEPPSVYLLLRGGGVERV